MKFVDDDDDDDDVRTQCDVHNYINVHNGMVG